MKIKALIILFSLAAQFVAAQQHKIDSIQKLYTTAKDDSLKIHYAYQLANLNSGNPTAAFRYLDEGERLAERSGRSADIYFAKIARSSVYGDLGNYPLAIKNNFEALKIATGLNNARMLMQGYDQLGATYDDLKDEKKAIYYTEQEIIWAKKRNDLAVLVSAYYYLSYYYNKLGQPQKALVYDKLGNELMGQVHNDRLKGKAYAGMAHSYLMLKRPEIGLPLLNKALGLLKTGDLGVQVDICTFASDYYVQAGPRDSAIKYTKKQLEVSRQVPYEAGVLDAAAKLGKLYDGHAQAKATFYYKTALELNQRLFDSEKTRAFQNLVAADEQQRREQAEQQRAAEEERKENLQLIAIALFIPVFIIILFRLRRTRLHRRVIDFMGVLSLLLVFEFITLLSHPFIERTTGHTPVLELIMLVAVASILVPAHHQLTHWLKERLAKPHENRR
jgi:tetratricopeptide (TPR) repeat protein